MHLCRNATRKASFCRKGPYGWVLCHYTAAWNTRWGHSGQDNLKKCQLIYKLTSSIKQLVSQVLTVEPVADPELPSITPSAWGCGCLKCVLWWRSKRYVSCLCQRTVCLQIAALDLLKQMLVFDPYSRISASGALTAPYLVPYHDPTDEPVARETFDETFNGDHHSDVSWRQKLYVHTYIWLLQCWLCFRYAEVLEYHKQSEVREPVRKWAQAISIAQNWSFNIDTTENMLSSEIHYRFDEIRSSFMCGASGYIQLSGMILAF